MSLGLTARLLTSGALPVSLPCPSHALFGIYCPFCGGTRAVSALTQGDMAAALRDNALVVAALPLAVGLWVWWIVGIVRGQPRNLVLPGWVARLILVVALMYCLARNVAAMRGVLTP